MKEIDLGRYRKARVWMNDLPLLGPRGVPREVLVIPGLDKGTSSRIASVEFYASLGGRFQYGLLGGQIMPAETNQLCVQIAVPDTSTEVFENPLLSTLLDISRLGLPEEYVDAVKTGICLAKQQMGWITAGQFIINQSAYSDIGSSPNTFKLLAIVLTRLLHITTANPSEQEVITIFGDALAAMEL